MSQLHRDHAPEQQTGMTSEEGQEAFEDYLRDKQEAQVPNDDINQEIDRRLAYDPAFFVDWTEEKDKEFETMAYETRIAEEDEAKKLRIKQGKEAFEEYMRNREDRDEENGDFGEAQVDEMQLIDDIIKRECYDQDFFDGWNRDREQDFLQNYNGEYDDLGYDDDCAERKESYDSDETVGEDTMEISTALQTILQRQDRQIAALKNSIRLRSQTAATDA